jgi:hypothetical protein
LGDRAPFGAAAGAEVLIGVEKSLFGVAITIRSENGVSFRYWMNRDESLKREPVVRRNRSLGWS